MQVVVIIGVTARRRVIVEGNTDAALAVGRARVAAATVQAGLHFDLVRLAPFGALLVFQVLFKGIRRFSFSFEVVGVVFLKLGEHLFEDSSAGGEDGCIYIIIPALVRATGGIRFPHQVGAFFVTHPGPGKIQASRRNGRSPLKGQMAIQAVDDEFPWCSTQSFHV